METLPVEILHRIFDSLNAETILFSLRSVCRLFRAIVNTYDRYSLDMKLVSKLNFYLLCRLIKPHNVISLTLSNDERTSGQIDLFLSNVRLRQFTRLRSITLIDIDQFQLNFILKRINRNLLTSLSFNIRKYDDRRIKTTNNLLAPTIAQPNLRKLEFDIKSTRMSKISWPITCSIHYLTINNVITMEKLVKILQCSPNLHTIIMKKNFDDLNSNMVSISSGLKSFPQLVSLTIEKFCVNIGKLETFLSMTPSLAYLKLIGGTQMLDGKRWEQFIQVNLPLLDKFEFSFEEWSIVKKTSVDLELLIASFQTSFWIEHKRWFVTCECDIDSSTHIHLYSIPICRSFLRYEPERKQLSLSTNGMMIEDNPTSNIKSIALTFKEPTADEILKKKATSTNILFPNVTEIEIDLFSDWPLFSLQSLSTIINISQIVQMKLKSYYYHQYKKDTLIDIGIFLEQAYNLSSLVIQSSLSKYTLPRTIENICPSIPQQLKHLQVPINSLSQIKMILERCENLLTIKFDIKTKFSEEIIQWFTNNTIDSTCCKGSGTISIWLGNRRIPLNNVQGDNKRIKLMNDQLDSE